MICSRRLQAVVRAFCLMWLATAGTPSTNAQTVTYNYANRVNFTEFKDYEWTHIDGASATDPTLDTEIRAAIDSQFAARGISKSVDGSQLLVSDI